MPPTMSHSVPQQSSALSVFAAVSAAKGALEGVVVRILGEVSEVSNKPGYKAVYFTIKDEKASLPCMMWLNRYNAAGVNLSVGSLVELSGRFTLYAPKGRMNFDVFSLSLAGEGKLRMQVAQLAKKLEAEGLTSAQRKRAIPKFPEVIGVVTSPRGAAIHDVLRTLRRRFPVARVLVAGVAVEGPSAPKGIIEGINTVCAAGAKVVLVVRGGGSFEDLMPFNDEALARAITTCPVPVVTGVGHETDTYIADMVSDARASTPTAAAEAVSPAQENLRALFASHAKALHTKMNLSLERCRTRLSYLSSRPCLSEPEQLFATDAQTLDIYRDCLNRALPQVVTTNRQNLKAYCDCMRRALAQTFDSKNTHVNILRDRLFRAGMSICVPYENEISVASARLHDLSPLVVLSRGYATLRNNEGNIIKSTKDVCAGDIIDAQVSDGAITCRVESIRTTQTELIDL